MYIGTHACSPASHTLYSKRIPLTQPAAYYLRQQSAEHAKIIDLPRQKRSNLMPTRKPTVYLVLSTAVEATQYISYLGATEF